MVRPAWQTFAATSAVAVAASSVLPTDGGWFPTMWQVAIGWASALAIVLGVRKHRPPAPAAWYLFAAGILLNSSGIGLEAVLTARGWTLDPPSIVDACYLALYPFVIAGLVVTVLRRKTRREWSSVVDAMMISTGVGLLAWVAVIRPALGDPTYTPLGQAVTIAYPIGDLVMLAMVVRLVAGSGARGPAFHLLGASVSAFLLGDTTWAVLNQFNLSPTPREQSLLQMVFLAAYALLGLAALHPSMVHLTRPDAVGRSRLGLAMVAVLTTVALIAPTLLMVEATQHHVTDGVAIAVGSMALFLLVILRMTLLYRQVLEQADVLQRLSEVDALTGLFNRRALEVVLPRALERARREGGPFALAMIDLDHFKRFNDRHGHPAGDRLLAEAARQWLAQLRANDFLGRYGGEEFVLGLPGTDVDTASDVLHRLHDATPDAQTFSAGLAVWDGLETGDELVARADAALYEAKRAGRNRTVVSLAAGASGPRPGGPRPSNPRATRQPRVAGHEPHTTTRVGRDAG